MANNRRRCQNIERIVTFIVIGALGCPARASGVRVDCFRLRTPGDAGTINQASDLCYGRLGQREGLWTACDRSGLATAGKIYFFSPDSLRRATPGGPLIADDEFTVVPPEDWAGFAARNRGAGDDVLADIRRRITPADQRGEEPFLDLEAITIGPSMQGEKELHLFVVDEEPYSAVLELTLEGGGKAGKARLVALYRYHEAENEHGTARNDGLEGFASIGQPGLFYFAEEGTKPVDGNPKALLFFLDPRLGLGRLENATVVPQQPISDELTQAVRRLRQAPSQTLNAITVLKDGRLLVVDRNGGWIDRVDPRTRTAERWLNLYDIDGRSLREILANFPSNRKLPYVSIEGVALDPSGAIWLCDDPAIPEGWRESCAVRITGLDALK